MVPLENAKPIAIMQYIYGKSANPFRGFSAMGKLELQAAKEGDKYRHVRGGAVPHSILLTPRITNGNPNSMAWKSPMQNTRLKTLKETNKLKRITGSRF